MAPPQLLFCIETSILFIFMATILLFDFGGQYAHLIARRVKEYGLNAKIVPAEFSREKLLKTSDVTGLIFSGGARSVYEKNAPKFDRRVLDSSLPILGICYGHQVIAHCVGGKVMKGKAGEYGPTKLTAKKSAIFAGVPLKSSVWMNHRDEVQRLPAGFKTVGNTEGTAIAAFENTKRRLYGVQFHPEVTHTRHGKKIIENFLGIAAGKTKRLRLDPQEFIYEAKRSIGRQRAVVGLSGGVDSAVAALLVGKAIGKNLLAVYVDTGLMRTGETDEIKKAFKKFPLRLKVIDASKRYFRALKGVSDPERKRKIIGKLFIDIFNEEAKKFKAQVLIQGTIYSDRIESGGTKHASTIKSHHNVGGLPKRMKLRVYEPLRELYKDEVRRLGKLMSLPDTIVHRKPFPGPGLAIRIIGEVMPEKVGIVQRASQIIEHELQRSGFIKRVWMAFPVLLSIKSVGIQGDARTYKYPLVLRIIESKDVMTANFSHVPWDVLEKISTRITNEIGEVNRVVYDISHKPPATMEWE